ncbi:caspase family protein [Natronohydrobacter thiooxidans]|uniref:caspase family protein n=1 Tax=Natronohydrobacter thiooxidans TaxID=87172 RepID=UPI0008FF336B|nr:caspase family protein [Natronohydrobacter thiooxidans]
MKSVAVLIGNAEYAQENNLPCCREDVSAFASLLEETGRFDEITSKVDLDADGMRTAVREALQLSEDYEEVFFFFSGHGCHVAGDLYLCGTNFDGSRPNETGLSHSDLIDIFRAATPSVLITVFDACFSGSPLVKGAPAVPQVAKNGLRNVLQFSSSLDSQTSLAGEKLSEFTRAFLEACVRKSDGEVFYTDIKNALRDRFLGNDSQTPFFVNQGTGRERLVDDVKKLATFKRKLGTVWSSKDDDDTDDAAEDGSLEITPFEPLTPTQALAAIEEKMATPEAADEFIGSIFDGVTNRFNESDFAKFFDLEIKNHSDFYESGTEEFMIRVLSREERYDRLVTAEIKREKKNSSPFQSAIIGMMAAMNQEWVDHYDLRLNCTLARAQIKIILTPKYRALKQLQLEISCAPSLEHCYVFEVLTQHSLADWEAFAPDGSEVVRRWYKLEWDDDPEFLVEKVCQKLTAAITEHIESTTKRIQGR